jgi:hypothetical protein
MRLRLGLTLALVAFSIAAAIPYGAAAQSVDLSGLSGIALVLPDEAPQASSRCEAGLEPVILDLTLQSDEGARYAEEFGGEALSMVRLRRGNEVRIVPIPGTPSRQSFELTGQISGCMTRSGSGFTFRDSHVRLQGPAINYTLDRTVRFETLAETEDVFFQFTYTVPVLTDGRLSRTVQREIDRLAAEGDGGGLSYLGSLSFSANGLRWTFDPVDAGADPIDARVSVRLDFAVLRAEN